MDIARSSIKIFVSKVASSVIQFLGIVFFAQELGAAPMGVFFLFTALLGMLGLLADFGIRGAIEKRLSEGQSRGQVLSSAIAIKILPITMVGLGILLFRPLVNGYLGADIAKFLVVALVLQEAGRLSLAVLRGELRVGETAVLGVTRQAIWVGMGAILVMQGFGVFGLVYGLLAGYIGIIVWGWHKVSINPGLPSREHAKSVFDYSQYNVVSSIGNYFYSWMDVAVIGLFLTQAHVGAYEIAWRVTIIPVLFSRSIATTIFPQVSEWSAAGEEDRIEYLIRDLLVPSLIFVIPAFFGSVVFSKDILRLIFGPEYVIAWVPLIILMFNRINEGANVILGQSLQAVNRPDLAARATVIGVIMNGGLNLVLVWKFGLIGAAIATVVASIISGVTLHTYYLSQLITIRLPSRELAGCVLSGMAMTAFIILVDGAAQIDSVVGLVTIIILGAFVYGASLLLFPSLRTTLFKRFRTIIGVTSG